MHAFDRQTDRILIARPRLHSMQCSKHSNKYIIFCLAYTYRYYFIFTALHGMQTRSYDEISVRLSVRLSVKRVICDKTEERYV